MIKSLAVLALLAFFTCSIHVHEQRYAPSTPGGTYSNSTGGNSYPSQQSSNNCNNPPNSRDPCQRTPDNRFQGATINTNTARALVGGKPYQFNGPRIIVCYHNVQCAAAQKACQYADYCRTFGECNAAIQTYGGANPNYQRCNGPVVMYPI